MRPVYIACVAHTWHSTAALDVQTDVELGKVNGPGLGFLAIYLTEEEAFAQNHGCDVLEILVSQEWLDNARGRVIEGEA